MGKRSVQQGTLGERSWIGGNDADQLQRTNSGTVQRSRPEIESSLRREIEEHLVHCCYRSAVCDGASNVIRLVGDCGSFANKLLSAMRYQFGGRVEKEKTAVA